MEERGRGLVYSSYELCRYMRRAKEYGYSGIFGSNVGKDFDVFV